MKPGSSSPTIPSFSNTSKEVVKELLEDGVVISSKFQTTIFISWQMSRQVLASSSRPVPIHQFWWMHSHSQFIPKNSECIQFTIHFEKKWIIQFIIHLKMNQFIFNSWNHATLFIFMRWFCLISCECRSARLLRNWRRFSRRFFRSRSSIKIEFRN